MQQEQDAHFCQGIKINSTAVTALQAVFFNMIGAYMFLI